MQSSHKPTYQLRYTWCYPWSNYWWTCALHSFMKLITSYFSIAEIFPLFAWDGSNFELFLLFLTDIELSPGSGESDLWKMEKYQIGIFIHYLFILSFLISYNSCKINSYTYFSAAGDLKTMMASLDRSLVTDTQLESSSASSSGLWWILADRQEDSQEWKFSLQYLATIYVRQILNYSKENE